MSYGFMTYDEAVTAPVTMSRESAIAEIRKHNASIEEFLSEVGDRQSYSSADVLIWLGY
ncbi:hypothetical protein [Cerasicoccus frondis]|uniref:hypothetical protein n=1 Tax=Cerasicoccus frondis TaxID=490090 RepID=UPI00285270DC|nr:hypothetical protein [Cerasicoccus frondis]